MSRAAQQMIRPVGAQPDVPDTSGGLSFTTRLTLTAAPRVGLNVSEIWIVFAPPQPGSASLQE